MDASAVLAQRLATQRLTGPPASTPTEAASWLLAVQAQDAPLARAMLALRSTEGTDASVRAAIDSGELIRTHVLRPTWHLVAATDLRWLLALTSPRVESGLVGRHRQLGLDPELIQRALDDIAEALADRTFLARPALGRRLRDRGIVAPDQPLFGQHVGHLLLVAELRGVICSGPLAGREHTYGLVDEIVPQSAPLDRDEALVELVRRFVGSHGPVALADLARWTRLTQAEMRAAVSALGDRVESVVVADEELWFTSETLLPEARPASAHLLSTFDEAFLTYRRVVFPRSAGHPAGASSYRFAEAGGGVVVCDRVDVGAWKRRVLGGRPCLTLELDSNLDWRAVSAVDVACQRLAATWTDADEPDE